MSAPERQLPAWLRADGIVVVADGYTPTINPKESDMNPSEELRLECLRIAVNARDAGYGDTVALAQRYYAFITGTDRAALASEAKAAIDRMAG